MVGKEPQGEHWNNSFSQDAVASSGSPASAQPLSKLLPSSSLQQMPCMCKKKKKKGESRAFFFTPTKPQRLKERHKPCEIRTAKISAGEEEQDEEEKKMF